MAKKPEATEATATGQGRAVTLPNGEKRIDYIRNEYYNKQTTRSDITKAINAMYGENDEGKIAYQIVFAATKTEADPRIQAAQDKKVKEAAKAEAAKVAAAEAAKEAAKAK